MTNIVDKIQFIKKNLIKKYYKWRVINALEYERQNAQCIICDNNNFELLYEKDRFNISIKTQKCNKCGLIMARPLPTEKFINFFYSSRVYRGLYKGVLRADVKFVIEDNGLEKALQSITFIKRKINLPYAPSILDVGSSYGTFLSEFKKEYNESEIYGLEPGVNFSSYNTKVLNGLYSGFNKIPKGKRFDLITSWHVLEHSLNPLQMLCDMKLHLKDQGFIIIEIPDADKYIGIKNIHIGHLYHFNRNTIKKLFEKAGLNIVEISDENLMGQKFGMKVIARNQLPNSS